MDFRLQTIRELLAVQRMKRAVYDPDRFKVLCVVLTFLFGLIIMFVMAYSILHYLFPPGMTSVM